MVRKLRVGVMVSGNGSNLQALIDSCKDPDYPAQIVIVGSDKTGVRALERARAAQIPFITSSCIKTILYNFVGHDVELICLAGFMRVIPPECVGDWHKRILNIHPSLLPKFKGLNAVEQAIEAGVSETGCTVHWVDEGVDTGEVIDQRRVPIFPTDTVSSLTDRIHHEEHVLYPDVLKNLAVSIIISR